jgi:hypothetical protein
LFTLASWLLARWTTKPVFLRVHFLCQERASRNLLILYGRSVADGPNALCDFIILPFIRRRFVAGGFDSAWEPEGEDDEFDIREVVVQNRNGRQYCVEMEEPDDLSADDDLNDDRGDDGGWELGTASKTTSGTTLGITSGTAFRTTSATTTDTSFGSDFGTAFGTTTETTTGTMLELSSGTTSGIFSETTAEGAGGHCLNLKKTTCET